MLGRALATFQPNLRHQRRDCTSPTRIFKQAGLEKNRRPAAIESDWALTNKKPP